MRLRDRLLALLGLAGRAPQTDRRHHRGPATHVIVLDGTMCSLEPGRESNAGQLYKLMLEEGQRANLSLYYEAGIQRSDRYLPVDVLVGRGINRQIKRAYGALASRYRPGDRIVLAGYSRGAFAVRSLAGVIDEVGLVRAECATERTIRQAYRHYRSNARGPVLDAFRAGHCHDTVEVEAIAVWDTVKALGLRLPIVWRWSEQQHAFHNHRLSRVVRHGFHALALDETRSIFEPVLWESRPGWNGHLEQIWFSGCHGDIGGQVAGHEAARPLANIPLVWMLERLEACGVPLPSDWRDRYACDAAAPSVGTWRGWGKLLLLRKRRSVGRDPSERLHVTVRYRYPALARRLEARFNGHAAEAPADQATF